ncbi:MAG TPA: valine--tRNA ligase [Nevskiaceae bacterium]|nr:valine--tRNA ligase [Nevskiaceae bacterium]
MEKTYQPQKVEEKIYKFWEKGGYFTPKIIRGKKPFTIIMPPPNANAPLHVGHGLVITLQDIMIRRHRMLGQPTLWLPGADHAGILTQVTFERKLAEKNQTRYDLGRRKFFAEILKFTLANKKTLENQIRALGASCDWTRNSFTLDSKFDKPIYTVFKKLYRQKLIYRNERMVNWCSRCQTALSDLEVEHKETETKLWYLRYPLKTSGKFIVVATTRPETMLGDTAVAVNSQDKRFKNLIGKTAILPLMNREVSIIADQVVDPEFGTGAVKVTPAHDPVDFEIGQKHKLKAIRVIGFDSKMTNQAGQYVGLDIKLARKKVLADLEKQGLLEKEEKYSHSVGHCERCQTIIESLISLQWFVKIEPLAKQAIKIVKDKKIKIIPARFEKIYFNWLENIRDWCVSRQLWWGHQLPVWYCGTQNLSPLQKQMNKIPTQNGCGEIIVATTPPKKCPKCGQTNLIRDPDTLDTWFSSGQWPFNTLGWFQKSQDFRYFYPTSVMETGYEILFFWVARMIMLGFYATGKIPFETVYLHGMIRDVFGQKMSKSRPETCIDPIKTVKKYGADALRMALVMGNAPGTDSSLSENKIKGMRNFANKIWNAARFILTNPETKNQKQKPKSVHKDDRWIINKLNKTIKTVTKNIENYRFDLAAEEIYQFFWHTFCDKYIEMSKKRRTETQPTLLFVLAMSLKLLHPFMPFITEEIYQKLPEHGKALIIEKWPR